LREKIGTWKNILQASKCKHNSSEDYDNDEQTSSANKKVGVQGAPIARIFLNSRRTHHDMLHQVPLERQKEVATWLREGYSEKQTQEKVEEFNEKQMKQRNKNVIKQDQDGHIFANLAG
jgi:hypothetical protein